MVFQFMKRWRTWERNTRHTARGFLVLAGLLITLTVVTGTWVVQQLNARDLQRIEQISELQIQQAAAQLDLVSTRYSMLLVGFAKDPNFIEQAVRASRAGQPLAPALNRVILANPAAHHVLWLNPQGLVDTSLRRVEGKLTRVVDEQQLDIAQVPGLQGFLSIKPQQLWFSDDIAIKTEAQPNPKPLIYGGVQVLDPQGQALGYLLLGVDVHVFAKRFINSNTDAALPQVDLLDPLGQLMGAPNTEVRWAQYPGGRDTLWAQMQAEPSGLAAPGLAWRRVSWGGGRAGDFETVRSTPLTVVSWMAPAEISKLLQHNVQLIAGLFGAALVLLLIAMGVVYRDTRRMQQLLSRESHVRRVAKLGYWRFEPAKQHVVLGKILLRAFDLRPNDGLWADLLASIATPQDRQALVDAVARCSLSGQRFELEMQLRHPTKGHTGWALVTGERSASGQIEGAMQDITQRKQAELSAEAFRSNLRNIVDWARLGVWEFDLVNGERRINKYLRDMLGLEIPMKGEYLVFNWAPLSHPDDVPAAAQARLDYIAGKTPYYSAQLRVKHSQGHWVSFALEGEHVAFDAQGQPTLIRGTAMDVTELHQARIDAEEANQAKTRFLSRMSHELRSPLNGIMGYAQLLRMSPNLDAQEQDHLNTVLVGARHLLNLINDLLQITRDDPPDLHLQRERLSLSELTLRCTSLMQPLMVEKQLVLHNRISAEHWVLGDRLRAKQCIINILANAIKFSPDGSRITLEVSQPAPHLRRLSVRDQGPGIAPEVGQQVFEPFYRSHDAQQTAEGSGIGLTVSLRLAQQMGGHISYESTLGVGTVFHLDLPAAAPEVTSTPAATVTHMTSMAPMTTSRTPAPAEALAERIS